MRLRKEVHEKKAEMKNKSDAEDKESNNSDDNSKDCKENGCNDSDIPL